MVGEILLTFSDDGEPSGTAGIPALEVIKKEDLRNVVVVVTRYFGGIHLGAGGLIRAYTKGAKIGLDAAKIVDMVVHQELGIKVDYNLYGKIENFLLANEYIVDEVTFDTSVNISIFVDREELDRFIKTITDLSSGNIEIKKLDLVHLPILDGKRLK